MEHDQMKRDPEIRSTLYPTASPQPRQNKSDPEFAMTVGADVTFRTTEIIIRKIANQRDVKMTPESLANTFAGDPKVIRKMTDEMFLKLLTQGAIRHAEKFDGLGFRVEVAGFNEFSKGKINVAAHIWRPADGSAWYHHRDGKGAGAFALTKTDNIGDALEALVMDAIKPLAVVKGSVTYNRRAGFTYGEG
ncbi:MAG: hypothetical protein AAF412_10030 [Pseudomonadota bacterium]